MKRVVIGTGILSVAVLCLPSSAAHASPPPCSVRGDGSLAIIPAVGPVVAVGSAPIEERMGPGVQLGGAFGWQLCSPALFLGVGATYFAFARPSANNPTLRTSTPQLIDAFLTARLWIWEGLFLDGLGGLSSSSVMRVRTIPQPGATSSRSTAVQDIASDGGAVFGLGIGYAIQLTGHPYDYGKAAFSIGIDPRLRVYSSGTVFTLPLVISVPLPLD